MRDTTLTNGKGSREGVKLWLREQFVGRARVIRCPHVGCAGVLLTQRREIQHPGGTGSRVRLRCTRHREAHETIIAMEPYATQEVERMRSAVIRQEEPRCARCGAEMVEVGGNGSGGATGAGNSAAYYCCSWCGVRWVSKCAATACPDGAAAVADNR